MSDQGSVYNCKNHENLRWFDTKPNGKLCFMGELTEDGKLKEASYESGAPMIRLKQYANNQNPLASLQLDPPITWERIVQYVNFVERAKAAGYAFECDCPGKDLVKLSDETYESVSAHPVADTKPL